MTAPPPLPRSPTATQGHTPRAQTLRPLHAPVCGRVGTNGPSPWGRFDQTQCVQWLCLLTLSVACCVLVTQPLMVSSPRAGVSPLSGAWARGAAPLGRVTIFRAREERGPGCTGLLVGLSSAPAIPLFPGVRLGTLSPGEQRAQHRATPGEWGAGSGGGGPAGYLGWAVRLVPTGAGPALWGADSAWRP